MEEEDHQEDVSYEVNYMYTRLVLMSAFFFAIFYYGHTRIVKLQEERKERFEGRASVDPTDPKNLKTDIEFAEPGGDWTLRDLRNTKFGSLNLRGNYYMLFFGTTLSPDVTPLTVMKMVNACKMIRRSKESQYINCKPVFVTITPDADSSHHMKNFGSMFDPQGGLILLREKSNKSENLVKMLKNYKVPIDFAPEEIERVNAYFEKAHQKDTKWYQFWRKKKTYSQDFDTRHSRVIYLMGPDNKFLQFYDIDVDQAQLAEAVMDEISYDIGIQYLGTGGRPITRK